MSFARLFFALFAIVALSTAAQAAPIALEEVQIGEDLAEKADEYGQRDIDRLVNALIETVTEGLTRDGHEVGETGDLRIVLTLEDAWPNRPTREQLSDRPGLSMQSLSLGGAAVRAEIFDAEGLQTGEIAYSWRTRHISDSLGRSTWGDAERTFDRFARSLAEELEHQPG